MRQSKDMLDYPSKMQRFPAMFDKPLKLPWRMRNKLNSSSKSSVTSWRREPNLFECAPIPIIPPLWNSVRPFLQAEPQDKVENSKNDRNWKKFDRKCSRHITFSLRYYRLYRPWIKRFDPCKSFLFLMTDGVAQQFHDKVQNPAFPRFFSRLIV